MPHRAQSFPIGGSRIRRLINREPNDNEEMRDDEGVTDDFRGMADNGASTGAAVWDVVRFFKDAGGVIFRTKIASNISWDDRANAIHWI